MQKLKLIYGENIRNGQIYFLKKEYDFKIYFYPLMYPSLLSSGIEVGSHYAEIEILKVGTDIMHCIGGPAYMRIYFPSEDGLKVKVKPIGWYINGFGFSSESYFNWASGSAKTSLIWQDWLSFISEILNLTEENLEVDNAS